MKRDEEWKTLSSEDWSDTFQENPVCFREREREAQRHRGRPRDLRQLV